MRLIDIKSIEDREQEDLFKIYLIPDGDWYRLYEWSAYLLNNVPSKRVQENKPLKITKKKNSVFKEGMISSGLKESFFPNYLPENFEPKPIKFGDNDLLVIDVTECFKDNGIAFEEYLKLLNDFKETVEFTPSKTQYTNNNTTINKDLVDSILEFSVFDSTPFECCKFIQTLQRKIINEFSSK